MLLHVCSAERGIARACPIRRHPRDSEYFDACKPTLAKLHEQSLAIRAIGKGSSELESFCSAIENFVKSRKATLGADICDKLAGCARMLISAAAQRGHIVDLCEVLGQLRATEYPKDKSACVREWQGIKSAGSSATTFLDVAAKLVIAARGVVGPRSDFFSPKEDDMIAITVDGQVYHFAWASGMSAITTGLATLSIVQVTTRALSSLVDDVVVTLVHMLQLDGVRRVNTSECKALNIMSPKDLLPLFVDERRLDHAIRSVKHVFDHRKEDLPSSVLLNLLHDVFESQPEGSEMAKALIDHRGLYASDPPCDNTASLTQLLLVLDMYVAVHELICLLGYFVRSFVGQDSSSCVNANHVKHEAAQVIKLFDSQQSCAEESLANDSFLELTRIQP